MQIKHAVRWTLAGLALTLLVAVVGLLIANEIDEPGKVRLPLWPPATSDQAHRGYLLMLGLAGEPGEDQLKAGEALQREIEANPASKVPRQKWERVNAKLLKHFMDSHYHSPAELEKNRAEIAQELAPLKEEIERYFAVIQNGVADVDYLKSAGWPSSNGIHLLSLSKAVLLHWNTELAAGHFERVIAEAQSVWKFHRANLELSSSLLEVMITLGSLTHVREFINDAGYDNPAFRSKLTPEVLASFQTQIDPAKVLTRSRDWELGWIDRMLLNPESLGEPWNSPLSRHFIARSHQRILNTIADLWQTGMSGQDYVQPLWLHLYPFAYGATTVLYFDLRHQLEKCQSRAAEFAAPIAFTPPKVSVN